MLSSLTRDSAWCRSDTKENADVSTYYVDVGLAGLFGNAR